MLKDENALIIGAEKWANKLKTRRILTWWDKNALALLACQSMV